MVNLAVDFNEVMQANSGSPLTTFKFLLDHGGLIIMYPFFIVGMVKIWYEYIKHRCYHHRTFLLMAVNVPKDNEQSMKAIEQIYSTLYGTKKRISFREKWWDGWTQPVFSLEIESDGGYIQFYIRCWDQYRDVVESAIYAQYPDAEIRLIPKEEDYRKKLTVPMIEDGSYDLFGADLVLDLPEIYCIRHWRGWEHSLPGKFIDPLAALLEVMSRLDPGEHFWYQIMIEPHDLDHLNHECQEMINKFIGEHKEKVRIIDKILDFPLKFIELIEEAIWPGEEGHSHSEEKEGKRIFLVEYEREAVTELDMKRSRWPFATKVRYIYFAKKENFQVEKGRRGFMGAIRQYKFLNNLSEGRWTKVELKDSWFFDNYFKIMEKRRLFARKRALIRNYKEMEMEFGETEGYLMSTEEIASLYHFPQIDVRAPFVQKAESRRVEPPTQLKFEGHAGVIMPKVEMQKENADAQEGNLPSPVPHPEGEIKTGQVIIQPTLEQMKYYKEKFGDATPMDKTDGTDTPVPIMPVLPIKNTEAPAEKITDDESDEGVPSNLPFV